MADWLNSVSPKVKPSTYAKYETVIRLHIEPTMGRFFLSEIDQNLIDRFARLMLAEGRCKNTASGRKNYFSGLSPKTVSDIMSVLKNALKYAQRRSSFSFDLCFDISQKQRPGIRVFSPDEQKRLCRYLFENLSLRNLGIFICLCTGLRIGEICALQRENISFEDRLLFVEKTMQRLPAYADGNKSDCRPEIRFRCADHGSGNKTETGTSDLPKTKIVITTPKSSCSKRIIPLPAFLVSELQKHCSHFPGNAYAYKSIRGFVIDAQQHVYSAVNEAMVAAYRNIGKTIYDVCGETDRAAYGKQVLVYISERLTAEFGKGFSVQGLRNMRQFYMTFPKRSTLWSELSWSHYRLLMRVGDENARTFYANESVKEGWSVRQLQRQINTMFYHRILASKDKDGVAAEIQTTVPKPEYEMIIKDPYVLEFLNLPKNDHFYESDLEQALIDHLQKFLLELGRGFSFVARQKNFNFDGRHFYIDLVFYNYILKCFVLIDLKTGDLTHQDIGQMQMYVNYYTRELMNDGDNPPIGILLCADKSDTLVRYTLPKDNTQIYAAKYMAYMPTEEELKRELNPDEFEKSEDEDFKAFP